MVTSKKKATKKTSKKKVTKRLSAKEEDLLLSPEDIAGDIEEEEEERPEDKQPQDELNKDFGKASHGTIDEVMRLLQDDEEPVDDTPRERFEWDDRLIDFPIRKKYKFRSQKTYYRLQLMSQPDWVDPNTRQIIKGKNKAAQFAQGRYDTKHEDVARLIYRSKAFLYGRIEDIDDVNAKAKETSYQALKATLTTAKDKKRLLRELIQELREEAASD
jgi:hypothetical protein